MLGPAQVVLVTVCSPAWQVLSQGPRLGRASEQEALHLVASHVGHRGQLPLGLDATGHHAQPHAVGQVDHAGHHRGVLGLRSQPVDEPVVHLEPVDGQVTQVKERGAALPEIVEGEMDPEVPNLSHDPVDVGRARHEDRLGELEDQ